MIDAELSLKEAEAIRGGELLAYLVANGWAARPSRVEGVSIVSKRLEGSESPVEFILPIHAAGEEEHRRIADALRTIAQIEGRSESSVANDIRQYADAKADKTITSSTPDKIADEVLDTVSVPRKMEFTIFVSSTFWDLQAENRVLEDFDLAPYFDRLGKIKELVYSPEIERVGMNEVVQLTHQLFELQYRDMRTHVMQRVGLHKQNVFLHYLHSTKLLESKIQSEMVATELAIVTALFDARMEMSHASSRWGAIFRKRVEYGQAIERKKQRDQLVEVLFMRHARFLYEVMQGFMTGLIHHDVL
jgi:hypothetical protein